MSSDLKRIMTFLIGILALSIALPAQDNTEIIEKSFRTEGGRPAVLEFHDVDGLLILSSSTEEAISVRIRKEVKIRDAKRAQRLLDDTKVEIEQRDNTVTIRIRYPRFRGLFFWLRDLARVKVVSEIKVPAGIQIKADLVDGSIRGENIQGDIVVDVVDGDVLLDGLNGTVRVDSVDGDTQVSGEIKGLDLKSVDGDIRVDLFPGSAIGDNWRIRTADGDMDIVLPEDFAADLEVRKGDGRLQTDWPLTEKGLARRTLSGKIGPGGPLFSIRTVDGRVTLRRR